MNNNFITRIEGHGSLDVDWAKGQVSLRIHEGERLFEGLLVGRSYEEMHWITPRICGVCPIAHNLASLAATEDAYEIRISETSSLLRDLMSYAQGIQSHVLHLFFLALPDYIGLQSGTDMLRKNPEAFKKAIALRDVGDEIAKVVAGRNVHPVTTTVGGFHKMPSKEDLKKLLKNLKDVEATARWAADYFADLKYPKLEVDLEHVALISGQICSSKGESLSISDYKKNIEEEVRSTSPAKYGRLKGREIMVGSMARLSLDKDISDEIARHVEKIDFINPFHNNLAQAIEILQYFVEARKAIKKLLSLSLDEEVVAPKGNSVLKGIGAVEAPRGGLYHEIHLDKDGIIKYANIITPTVQNLTSIEKSAQAVLDQNRFATKKKKEKLLNMIVRAYDPCISCAVH